MSQNIKKCNTFTNGKGYYYNVDKATYFVSSAYNYFKFLVTGGFFIFFLLITSIMITNSSEKTSPANIVFGCITLLCFIFSIWDYISYYIAKSKLNGPDSDGNYPLPCIEENGSIST